MFCVVSFILDYKVFRGNYSENEAQNGLIFYVYLGFFVGKNFREKIGKNRLCRQAYLEIIFFGWKYSLSFLEKMEFAQDCVFF